MTPTTDLVIAMRTAALLIRPHVVQMGLAETSSKLFNFGLLTGQSLGQIATWWHIADHAVFFFKHDRSGIAFS